MLIPRKLDPEPILKICGRHVWEPSRPPRTILPEIWQTLWIYSRVTTKIQHISVATP